MNQELERLWSDLLDSSSSPEENLNQILKNPEDKKVLEDFLVDKNLDNSPESSKLTIKLVQIDKTITEPEIQIDQTHIKKIL